MVFYVVYGVAPMVIVRHSPHLTLRVVYSIYNVKLKADRLKAVVLDLAHGNLTSTG